MSEAATRKSDPLERIWGEICDLGLEAYVADLDAHGLTVIPPEIASPDGLADQLLAALLDIAERRNGVRPDLETGSTHASVKGRLAQLQPGLEDSPVGDLMQSLIFEGRVFEQALMNPVLLAMASYLCGYEVVLSSMGCFMKGPNKEHFSLHVDASLPSPLPSQAMVCNATYVLTDFNLENGSTAFVPGSHKWCRSPTGVEARLGEGGNSKAIAVEAAPGSLVVWHGNTWHGAFRRVAPGLRVSIPVYLARQCMRTQEDLIGKIPQQMLDRNPPRFGILTQQGIAYGWESQDDCKARDERASKFLAAYSKAVGPAATDLA